MWRGTYEALDIAFHIASLEIEAFDVGFRLHRLESKKPWVVIDYIVENA